MFETNHDNPSPTDAAASLSRRKLLAILAGVPLSRLAGCGGSQPFAFGGELISPNFSIGHRMRDGWRPDEPNDPPRRRKVVIVGGGIAGLSAAWRLLRNGVDDFVVLELEDSPGGTSRSGNVDSYRFPWGAHYVPVPMRESESLIQLFREMNVITGLDSLGDPIIDERFLCRDPEERVFADGHWQYGLYPADAANQDDQQQLQRFRKIMHDWASKKDESGRRLFAIPMATGSDSKLVRALDEQSMMNWMVDQGLTSERLLWLVNYACRDDYGLTIAQTSAWAGVFYFASRLRADREDSQPVMTWPEGNGRIVDYLARQCGDRLMTGHAVTRIEPDQNGGAKVRSFDLNAEQTIDWIADDVIFSCPQFTAPHLIEGWQSTGRSTNSFRYGGWMVGNVHLRDRPAEAGVGMCWDNVIAEGSESLGYVTSTHQLGLDYGSTVLTWYFPLTDDDPRLSRAALMKLGWADWAAVCTSDLKRAHPDIQPLISRMDFMRWGHAMIQPRVGFVWGGERERACQSIGRVHFAATDLSGVALMEEAFDRGIRAADRCSPIS